jgi:hypothetical protein
LRRLWESKPGTACEYQQVTKVERSQISILNVAQIDGSENRAGKREAMPARGPFPPPEVAFLRQPLSGRGFAQL